MRKKTQQKLTRLIKDLSNDKDFHRGSDGEESGCNADLCSIPGWEDPLEKEMATHSSILAWRIPWTEEPGRLQSMGSQRVRHDLATITHSLSDKDIPDLSTATHVLRDTGIQKYWGQLLPGPPTPWHILEGLGPFS